MELFRKFIHTFSKAFCWLALALMTLMAEEILLNEFRIFERLFGKGKLSSIYQELIVGEAPWIKNSIFIIFFILILAISVIFLFQPAAEALRRFKSPHRFYWSDKRLLKQLESLSEKLSRFIIERESTQPAPGDDLNYILGDAQGVEVERGASQNLFIGQGTNPLDIRHVMQKMNERENHLRETIYKYDIRFAGRIRAALTEAKARTLIIDEKEQVIIDLALRDQSIRSYDVYRERARLLSVCAERLRESNRWLEESI